MNAETAIRKATECIRNTGDSMTVEKAWLETPTSGIRSRDKTIPLWGDDGRPRWCVSFVGNSQEGDLIYDGNDVFVYVDDETGETCIMPSL